ncbi:MAG TPA: pyroglutamyl-peptidase I [Planctomycetota bacterium]|nr:pyroglutamyl-peptidase I [Planctomycetota bacterium]
MRLAPVLALAVALSMGAAWADDSKGTILVTGFVPFEGPVNPSWEAVKDLNGKVVDGYTIMAVQLPVDWKKVPKRLEALIKQYRPVSVISFGEGSANFDVETIAHNHVDPNLKDNAGKNYKKPKIEDDGPDTFSSTLPVDALKQKLTDMGLTANLSSDAGSYLCEYTFYLDRYFMQKYGLNGPAGFVHVPYAQATETDFSQDQKAALAVVQTVADQVAGVNAAQPPATTPGVAGAMTEH